MERPDRKQVAIEDRQIPQSNSNESNQEQDGSFGFHTIFELRSSGTQTLVSRPSSFDLKTSTLAQIASYTATSGQVLNIPDVKRWLLDHGKHGDADFAHTILCLPIMNGKKDIIGVTNQLEPLAGFNRGFCRWPS